MVWDAEQDDYRVVTTQPGNASPFWSPDSRQIGLATNNAVVSIDLYSGAKRTLTSWPNQAGWITNGGTWSPDGETVVFSVGPVTVGQRLYGTSASGGKHELLFEPSDEEVGQGRGFFDPSFLPTVDGRQALLYAEGAGYPDIGVINLETGERRTIVSGDPAYGRPIYSPSGHVIYRDSHHRDRGRLWALPFSLERLEPTGDPFVIAESAGYPGISDHGMLTYGKPESTGTMQLTWRDRGGKRLGSIGEA